MPLPFYHPKSTGRGKTIYCFVGQYTCHAVGKGINRAKCEQRLSCLGAGGRVWLCFVPVANNLGWGWLSSLLRMRQTAKKASKRMGVFWSTLERVCFLSPLAQWHTHLDDWSVTELVGKCQWKNAEKEQIFLQMLVTIFLPLVNPNQ